MKIVSKELKKKFDEFAEREFTEEEKKKANKNHWVTVIFSAICITYIVYTLTMLIFHQLT